MKKVLISLLLIVLLIPFLANAEECDNDKITITSLEQKSIKGGTEIIADPVVKDRNINFNLKMHDIGDSISYDMTINNESNDDYMIDENNFKTDSDHIEYSIETKDGNNVVKAKSSKEVVLSVTYKTEVDDSLFENGKYNASNELKLALNADDKEEKMDIIITDNIKKDVKNPNTNNSGIRTALVLSIVSAIILLLTIYNKTKINKYVIILFIIISIPMVYAVCTADIKVESKIEIEKLEPLNKTLISMTEKENSCMTKYEGDVTEEVGKTVPATKVYFDTCEERNVIFGGFCWQIVRTTETGGTKMIYNGEPVDGKCEKTRGNHKGIIALSNYTYQFDNTDYLYGNSFTYDTTTNKFILQDTTTISLPSIWDSFTATEMERIFGKYTCRSNTDTCETMYYVNSYTDNYFVFNTTAYSVGDTGYGNIGTSPFNSNDDTPSSEGYMFNKIYNVRQTFGNLPSNYLFGNNVSYSASSNTYTLLPASGESTLSTVLDDNHHYTCANTTGTCSIVRYYFASSYSIHLNRTPNVQSAINEMFYNDDVNKYNSNIKGVVDSWYAQNLVNKNDKLEDVVYCNSRNISNLSTSSWNPNGGSLSYFNTSIRFGKGNTTEINCLYDTDQFAVSNGKAKLTYPVGLISWDEVYYFGTSTAANNLRDDGEGYWTLTPSSFRTNNSIAFIYSGGYLQQPDESPPIGSSALGVRPTISLNSDNLIASGTGTETDPWIIKED